MTTKKSALDAASAGLGALFAAVTGLVGGWIVLSKVAINHHEPLPPAIDAPRGRFASRNTHALNFYADRNNGARPLVLLHSINAAASSYEMRPIFQHYRGVRSVYALDLPGFGFSERANRVYSPELFAEAIASFMAQKVGEPADVIALSLTSEFAARAALENPDLFHSLTLISPSGFAERGAKRGSQQASEQGTSDTFYDLLAFSVWSQPFFDLLTTRGSIRYFLKQSFAGPVDPGLVEYSYATSHQAGARYAPLYFVSGKLFTPVIRESVYDRLSLPVLVLYDEDNFVRFDTLPDMLARCGNWQAQRITPTRGLPQFEQMAATAQALEHFWLSIE